MTETRRKTDGFSLLLPVYGGDDPEHMRLAFDSSVRDQALPPSEVVIVRDGPVAPAMESLLNDLEREEGIPVRVLRLTENVGLTRALNAGLATVRYEIVARMDADDVSHPERFVRQWGFMQRGFDLVGTGMAEFERDPDEVVARRVPPVGSQRIREHARTHNPFNHPTMMYRVSALERVGWYEPFGKMEDYWLGIRLIAGGAKVENIPDPLVRYRVGAGAFHRRGGWREARTEIRLQRAMLDLGFISRIDFVRNTVMKGTYRLLPAGLKRVLFRRFVGEGLPGDRGPVKQ